MFEAHVEAVVVVVMALNMKSPQADEVAATDLNQRFRYHEFIGKLSELTFDSDLNSSILSLMFFYTLNIKTCFESSLKGCFY